jgi:hypothetical protein
VISLLSLVWGLVAIAVKLTCSVLTEGKGASLIVLVTFLAGIQLIVLGMMGLYVARASRAGPSIVRLCLVASSEGLGAGPSGPRANAAYCAPRGSQPSRH